MRKRANVAPSYDRAFIEGKYLNAAVSLRIREKSASLILCETTNHGKIAALTSDDIDAAGKTLGIVRSTLAKLDHGNNLFPQQLRCPSQSQHALLLLTGHSAYTER
jgi:hypothetical protein